METVTVEFILLHPEAHALVTKAWRAAYSSYRKEPGFQTRETASNCADVDVAGQLGMSVDAIQRLRNAGLELHAV